MLQDADYLHLALCEAQARRGRCAPNPAVGAVLVREGRVLAQGTHWACGQPHAEVVAIAEAEAAGESVAGALLYVTLEPCCHQGRTPPCTELIIRKGIARVIFSEQDPNPKVSGRGARQLSQAGVVCEHQPQPEITEFYASYRHWTAHRRPRIHLKLAMSTDGKIAGPGGVPVAITGEVSRRYTHQHRLNSDALLTTVTTIIHDDPCFNVRLSDPPIKKPLYILDRECRLPLMAQVLKTASPVTIFYASAVSKAQRARLDALQSLGLHCVPVADTPDGLSLDEVLCVIGNSGAQDLWVEVGARATKAFLEYGVSFFHLLVGQKVVGGMGLPAPSECVCLGRLLSASSDQEAGVSCHDLSLSSRITLGEDTGFIFSA